MVSLLHKIKKRHTGEVIYHTTRDTKLLNTKLSGKKKKRKGPGMNEEVGTNVYTEISICNT